MKFLKSLKLLCAVLVFTAFSYQVADANLCSAGRVVLGKRVGATADCKDIQKYKAHCAPGNPNCKALACESSCKNPTGKIKKICQAMGCPSGKETDCADDCGDDVDCSNTDDFKVCLSCIGNSSNETLEEYGACAEAAHSDGDGDLCKMACSRSNKGKHPFQGVCKEYCS